MSVSIVKPPKMPPVVKKAVSVWNKAFKVYPRLTTALWYRYPAKVSRVFPPVFDHGGPCGWFLNAAGLMSALVHSMAPGWRLCVVVEDVPGKKNPGIIKFSARWYGTRKRS